MVTNLRHISVNPALCRDFVAFLTYCRCILQLSKALIVAAEDLMKMWHSLRRVWVKANVGKPRSTDQSRAKDHTLREA